MKRAHLPVRLPDAKGKFEQANGGTLFLDEIGDMSRMCRQIAARVEERRIERLGGDESIPSTGAHIISATASRPGRRNRRGNFRADLFYRLRVVTIDIAPLRERRERHSAFWRQPSRDKPLNVTVCPSDRLTATALR